MSIFSCRSSSMMMGSNLTTTSRYDSPPFHNMSQHLINSNVTPTSIPIIKLIIITIREILWIRSLRNTMKQEIIKHKLCIPTSISSYVMPSHTPASSSSSAFHVSFGKSRCCAVSIVRCNVEVHTYNNLQWWGLGDS